MWSRSILTRRIYLAPEKGGAKAYSLLHRVLVESGLAGVAKVVIRPPREHLAILKPQEDILILETMHFADELRDPAELKPPSASVGEKEMKMASTLVESMSGKWEPQKYHDEYREGLMKVIEEKVKSGSKSLQPTKSKGKPSAGKVIDLVSLLQESLSAKGGSGKNKAKAKKQLARKRAA
jgi:DNA end-binding protein Ku